MIIEKVQCSVKIQKSNGHEFESNNGLRQENGLSCLLFNVALKKAVRDSGIQRQKTIATMSVKLVAYANDVDIIGRSYTAMADTFFALVGSAKRMGLTINEKNTEYNTRICDLTC
ncbi:hypothetical protein ANN_18435 [Periplaneta americana]|uniref:Reverse transcriptase domain-containing protein n=1 Tax=Periplaneta americana TaxID=6978 RepID=A0ABQ8SPZ7_PERAM|nr:hypothetical protein ANN_18435 [Periplaneta americana]